MTPEQDTESGLQHSLDQIERLAAELKEIAEVITPSGTASGAPSAATSTAPSAAAEEVTADLSAAMVDSDTVNLGQPGLAWLDGDTSDIIAPDEPVRTGRSVVQAPLAPEPVRHGSLELVFGPGTVLARHVGDPPAGKPSPEPSPDADGKAAARKGAGRTGTGPTGGRATADPGEVSDVAAWAVGASKAIPEPLYTDADVEAAMRFAESDLAAADAAYFEAEQAFAAAERAKRQKAAADKEAGKPPEPDPEEVSAKSAAAAAAVAAGAAAGRAGVSPEKAETKIGAVPAVGAVRRPPGPVAPRKRRDFDMSAKRRAFAVLTVAAVAVPAIAIGTMQPWNRWTGDQDKLGVVGSERSGGVATEEEAAPAVPNGRPNPNPAPSIGVAPGPAAAGVLVPNGGGVASPKISPVPLPTPSAHRNDAPTPGLSLIVRADDVRPLAGTPVRFTLTWKDGTGFYAGTTLKWDDGSPEVRSVNTKPCTGDAPKSGSSMSASHTFNQPGTYTVQLSVSTYTCDSRTETQTVPMTITVTQPAPTPSPSPPASPSPAPSQPVAPPT